MTAQSEFLHQEVQTLERQLRERDEEIARLQSKLADWWLALQSLTPGGSEFQSPETCEAYVRDRLHRGQDLAKEVVRTYREITDLRERFHHCHKQAEDLNDTTCRECGLDIRNPIHRREER